MMNIEDSVQARCTQGAQQRQPAADAPQISVIIPALNEAGVLLHTLRCLQPLRRRGHEVLVVDGGSTDSTREEAMPLTDRVLQAPRGRAQQMHAGVLGAAGSVFWFLHADTQPPEAADQLIRHALAGGDGTWGWFEVRLSDTSPLLKCVGWLMNRRSRLTGIATGDQGIFMQRAAYERSGGFPMIPIMEDIALSRRLRRLGSPQQIATPLLCSSRRWQKHGIVRTIITMWCLRLGYALGIDPQRLVRFYAPHRA